MAGSKFPVKTAAQYRLEENELCTNPEARTPITVCIDCSFSMRQRGQADKSRLERVLEGLETFRRDMARDMIACGSVEMCIISFGGAEARVECDFTHPDRLRIPRLEADGETPLADAVFTAMEVLEQRKRRYSDNGITYTRPWLILIGDGDESGSSRALDRAAAVLKAEHDAKHLNVMCVTVGDEGRIEYASLMKLAPDGKVQYLRDMKFSEFFGWLSKSIQRTSQSLSGEEIAYEPTASWGEVIGRG